MNRLLSRAKGRLPQRSPEELVAIREACQVAARILDDLCERVSHGVSTYDIEAEAKRLFGVYGAQSPCYQYQLPGHTPFPAFVCLSLNDEIVHGYGAMRKVVRNGDNLTVDVAVRYNGWIGDNARTVAVGEQSPGSIALLEVTREALEKGIEQARPGNRVGNISSTIQKFVERHGFGIIREYCGHGVGRTMHEEPQVPNFGRQRDGARLQPGVVMAIEPMVCMGRPVVKVDADTWTARTADGKLAAHFEHTVLVTEGDPEILTFLKK